VHINQNRLSRERSFVSLPPDVFIAQFNLIVISLIDARLNRESVRIPRRLRRGKRVNHKKDPIPYGRRFPRIGWFAADGLNGTISVTNLGSRAQKNVRLAVSEIRVATSDHPHSKIICYDIN
jgi:hypothetical protein